MIQPNFGILQPLVKHRFIMTFPTILHSDILSRSAIRCSFDLLNDTISFEIEQPLIDSGTFGMVRLLCKDKNDIEIHCMDGGDNSVTVLRFEGCQVTSHSTGVDYAESGAVVHKLTASFGRFKSIRQ